MPRPDMTQHEAERIVVERCELREAVELAAYSLATLERASQRFERRERARKCAAATYELERFMEARLS